MERKTAWNEYKKKDMKKLEKLNAGYRAFLDNGKTERECVKESVRQAEEAGYVNLDTYVKENRALKPGDKVYAVCMKKAIALFQIGTRPLTEGMNILGAHIDSPRLDVKQNPLYEDNGFTYLDTHYYGGIKKWQWVTLPPVSYTHLDVYKRQGIMFWEYKCDPSGELLSFIKKNM